MNKEITLEPTLMIEELQFHILHNEMNGELDPDSRWFPLHLQLQHLLDKLNNSRHDLYVSVSADETKTQ